MIQVFSFTKISLRKKLIIGFGGITALALIIGVASVLSLFRIESYVDEMLHTVKPVAEKSNLIEKSILHAGQSFGFYLLSRDDFYRELTEVELKQSVSVSKELLSTPPIQSSKESKTLLLAVLKDIESLEKHKDVAYKITENQKTNIPGFNFSQKLVEPISKQVLEILTDISSTEGLLPNSQSEIVFTLLSYWHLIEMNLHDFLNFRQTESLDEIKLQLSNINRIVTPFVTDPEDASDSVSFVDKINKIYEFQKVYETRLDTLVSLHTGDKWRKDTYLIRKKIGPLVEKIKSNLDRLVEIQENNHATLLKDLNTLSVIMHYNLSVLMLFVIAAAVLILFLLKKLIIERINKAVYAMDDIGDNGNLNQLLEDEGSDEISSLATGFNKFVRKIKGVIDLVNTSSSSLAKEAKLMSQISNNAKDGVVQQQSKILEVTEAINDMSGILDGISTNAGLAADAAEEANEYVIKGNDIVATSIQSTNNLASDVDVTREVIQKLMSEIEDIGSILAIIKGISDQTNLLALNAAIEAARAGESGRGFAVVADEVRTLSQRTQQETQGIHNKIENLKTEARAAVAAIEKGEKTARQNVELVATAGDALNSITSTVKTITEMSQKIASNVEAQSHNSTTISTNMASITQIASETADVVINASKSNHELSLMAGQLRGMVQQFLFNESCNKAGQEDEMFHTDFEHTKNNDTDVNDSVDDVLF